MYLAAIDTLAAAGYEHHEISNFARPGFACRHNLACWANEPYIGIGPSATSWYDGHRTALVADVDTYIEIIDSGGSAVVEDDKPTPPEVACETAVLNLRRTRGIELAKFRMRTGLDALRLFAEPIREHSRAGLLAHGQGRVFLTCRALPIADSIICDFAAV